MTRLLVYILYTIIILSEISMQAQNSHIKGEYNPDSGIFETSDKSYWIDMFDGDYAKISKNGYMGLIDKSGKIILEPIYDRVIGIDSLFIWVALDGKFISIERAEEKKFNPNYYVTKFNNEGIARYTEDGEFYGFIDKQGQATAKPFIYSPNSYQYISAPQFIGGRYGILCTCNEWIVYDKTGKRTTIRSKKRNEFYGDRFPNYHENIPYNTQRKVQITQPYFLIPETVDRKLKYYYLDDKLERLSDIYFDAAEDFVKDYAVVNHKGKWGILNTKGELFETDYDGIQSVENGTFIVSEKVSEYNFKRGVINSKGDTLIPLQRASYIEYLFDDLYSIGGNIIVDINNRELLSRKYSNISKFSDNIGFCFFKTKSINLDAGKILSRLDEYKFFGYVYFFNKDGLINEKGVYTEYTGPQNASMTNTVRNMSKANGYRGDIPFEKLRNIAIKKTNNTTQLVEFAGYYVFIPIPHEKFIILGKGSNNKFGYGLIDIDNKVLVPFEYNEIKECAFNILLAKKGNKWGAINYKNEIIIPFMYKELCYVKTGFIAVKNKKHGLINLLGKEIIPFEYDDMYFRDSGIFSVEKGNKEYIINKRSEIINK